MHPTSIAIKSIIEATPGYSLAVLLNDLGSATTPDRFLDSKQVCEILSVKRSTVFNMVRAGTIQKVMLHGSIPRYRESDVQRLVKA